MEPPRIPWTEVREEVLIAPSLLSADFTAIGAAVRAMEGAGARVLHLDVMDGHFVPNITFGPPLVASVRRRTSLYLDAHLMITDPLAYLDPFARAGADGVTLHVEAAPDFPACRERADALGVRLGLAIRPDTPVLSTLERHGRLFDLILVMTVMPGFGGQSFMEGSVGRIAEAAAWCRGAARTTVLEVDGGIQGETAAHAAAAGARWLVAGNAVFRTPDPARAFRELQEAARRAAGG